MGKKGDPGNHSLPSLNPWEEGGSGIIINVYKYLMGVSKESAARVSSVLPVDRRRGNGHKLKYRKYIRKNFSFYCEGDQTLEQVARQV